MCTAQYISDEPAQNFIDLQYYKDLHSSRHKLLRPTRRKMFQAYTKMGLHTVEAAGAWLMVVRYKSSRSRMSTAEMLILT